MSNKNVVIVDMRGLKRLIRKISEPWYVDIGILSGVTYPETGVTVAYIGSIHEFGTDKAGRGNNTVIPERSWLRMPLEEKSKEITKDVANSYKKLMEKQDIEGIFELIGQAALFQILKAFETGGFGNWSPLAEATVRLKDDATILVETTLLVKTIDYKVGKK